MIDLIKQPVLTEKSVRLIERHNQYTFDVAPHLSKPQIRTTLQSVYNVQVLAVNTYRRPREYRRLGAFIGEKPRCKRVIVTVLPGQKIPLFSK